MVATVGSISVDLSANTAKFIAGFQKSATTVERESKRISASMRSIEASGKFLERGVSGFFSAQAVRQLASYADAWTTAGNKIRAASQVSGVQTRSLKT